MGLGFKCSGSAGDGGGGGEVRGIELRGIELSVTDHGSWKSLAEVRGIELTSRCAKISLRPFVAFLRLGGLGHCLPYEQAARPSVRHSTDGLGELKC